MTTTLETISISVITSIVSILVTFHIVRLRFHRVERQKYREINEKVDANHKDLKDTLVKIVTALCNCNGLGERFKYELEKASEAEEIVS